MKGIEAFINLENLDCEMNQLTTMNDSNNTALTLPPVMSGDQRFLSHFISGWFRVS